MTGTRTFLTTRNATVAALLALLRAQHVAKLDVVTPARHLAAERGWLRLIGVGEPRLTVDGVTVGETLLRPTAVADAGIAEKLGIPRGGHRDPGAGPPPARQHPRTAGVARPPRRPAGRPRLRGRLPHRVARRGARRDRPRGALRARGGLRALGGRDPRRHPGHAAARRAARRRRPDRLATATLAAVQGGLLLTQVRRDTAPLEAALDMAIVHIRSFAT